MALAVSPPPVVIAPSGTLPERKAIVPTMLIAVAVAVATRARLEELRAWRMRSWAILCSMLL
jgi:hypothetical protein